MTETVALYMRLSSEDANEGESFSIGNQRDLLYHFLKDHREFDGCTVMEFCDDGYTGTNFDRPEVKKMLSMAGNPIRCIIVKDFSRFGRNLIEVGDYLDQIFPFLGVRFIAVNEDYDSKNSLGSAVSLDVSLKAMVYEMYSRDISEKIRCVQKAKMKRGEYLCAIAFYGYKKSKAEKNKLEIDEPAADVVRRIFRMAAEGTAPTQIALRLNTEGILSPLAYRRRNHTDGGRGWKVAGDTSYWTRENVRRIICDERYTGCLVCGKRTAVDVSKKQTVKVPKEDWIVVKDTHEAVVPKDIFAKAQKVLRSCSGKTMRIKPSQRFRELLKCGVCGKVLVRSACKEPYFYCLARRTVPDALCGQIHLREQDLETALLVSIQNQARLLLETEKEHEEENFLDVVNKEIRDCQAAASRCKAKQAVVFEDYAEGRITRQEYLSCKRDMARQQEEMTAMYTELNVKRVKLQQMSSPLEKSDLGRYACVSELTRELLVELVKEILVSGKDTLEIVWNFKEWMVN